MKKKTALIIGVPIGSLLLLWYTVLYFNIIRAYKMPSEANEPTIKLNSRAWVSCLKKPNRFDFIVVWGDLPDQGRRKILFRLCGLPGDVIEIRDGLLYINSKPVDDQFDLNIPYKLPSSELPKFVDSVDMNKVSMVGDTINAFLSSKFVHRHQLVAQQDVMNKEFPDIGIRKKYNRNWNQDHFGPFTVPPDHYFILGDNRHGACDSRYIGPIPMEDFVATMLN